MLPPAHAGISVAIAFALEHSLGRNLPTTDEDIGLRKRSGWCIDYRLVILGSLLPDIIDKPLEFWLLHSRSFGHTLLFANLLILLGVTAMGSTRLRASLVLSISSAGHLLLDTMWEIPETILWPLYGLSFGGAEFDDSPPWLRSLQVGMGRVALEVLGALVLVTFVVWLYRRRTILKWFKTGMG